ncbi:DUF982 domain-containing protein [Mesorhizobium delmotii]
MVGIVWGRSACERAAEMLIKALHGEATRDEARAAFEAAAKAAGILVNR